MLKIFWEPLDNITMCRIICYTSFALMTFSLSVYYQDWLRHNCNQIHRWNGGKAFVFVKYNEHKLQSVLKLSYGKSKMSANMDSPHLHIHKKGYAGIAWYFLAENWVRYVAGRHFSFRLLLFRQSVVWGALLVLRLAYRFVRAVETHNG